MNQQFKLVPQRQCSLIYGEVHNQPVCEIAHCTLVVG